MPFCPECGREYVPGFAECVDCRLPLSAEPPVEPRNPGNRSGIPAGEARPSRLLWLLVGTAAGASAGALVGLGLAITLTVTGPDSDLGAAGFLLFALLGTPYGAIPGLLGGLFMAIVDPWLPDEQMRKALAALTGLGVGALFGFIYPPLLLLTSILGPLTGWISAGLATRLARRGTFA